MIQLAKSNDAVAQKEAVVTLRFFVCDHSKNKSVAIAEGAIAVMVQLAKSSDADLQREAVETLRQLASYHAGIKTLAAVEGAIPLMVQLAKSSNFALQREALLTLGYLVMDHSENQSAAEAAGAIEHMLTLTAKIEVALEALDTLDKLLCLSSNASKAVSLGAIARLTQLKGCRGDSFDKSIGEVLSKLESKAAAETQAAQAAAVRLIDVDLVSCLTCVAVLV
jgi:hypothetical protein